jgi:hypothetical protein
MRSSVGKALKGLCKREVENFANIGVGESAGQGQLKAGKMAKM